MPADYRDDRLAQVLASIERLHLEVVFLGTNPLFAPLLGNGMHFGPLLGSMRGGHGGSSY
jgi:hypothetical protein